MGRLLFIDPQVALHHSISLAPALKTLSSVSPSYVPHAFALTMSATRLTALSTLTQWFPGIIFRLNLTM